MDFLSGKTGDSPHNPFSVVLAYDEQAAAERVVGLYNFLTNKFKDRLDFHCTKCNFGQLKHPVFAGEATDVAAEANLVIIGTMDGEHLPSEVVSWIEGWIGRNAASNTALIGMVKAEPQDNSSATSVHRYLQATATIAGITFFPGSF